MTDSINDKLTKNEPNENEPKEDISLDEEISAFDNITDISDKLLRGIFGMGFEIPSSIQRKAINPIYVSKQIHLILDKYVGPLIYSVVSLVSSSGSPPAT